VVDFHKKTICMRSECNYPYYPMSVTLKLGIFKLEIQSINRLINRSIQIAKTGNSAAATRVELRAGKEVEFAIFCRSRSGMSCF